MTSSFEICDHQGCPARATVAFVRGYLELTFCQHHAQKLKQALARANFECIDTPEAAK